MENTQPNNPEPNPNQQPQQPDAKKNFNVHRAADQAVSPLPTSREDLHVDPKRIGNRNVMPRVASGIGTEFGLSDAEKERAKMTMFAMEDRELREYAERYGLVYRNGQLERAGVGTLAARNFKKVMPSFIGTSAAILVGYGAKRGMSRYQNWKASRQAAKEESLA